MLGNVEGVYVSSFLKLGVLFDERHMNVLKVSNE